MKIKRLSLIITLALCLTIGGVYATWTYAEGEIQSNSGNTALSIDKAVIDGEAGQITVDTSGITITVDDGGSYNTTLNVTGDITVTLTPTEGTDESVLPTSFKWSISLSETAAAAKFGEEKILTVADTEYTGEFNNKSATIAAEQIKNAITLTEVTLETSAEHDDYKEVIDRISTSAFTITVTPVYN